MWAPALTYSAPVKAALLSSGSSGWDCDGSQGLAEQTCLAFLHSDGYVPLNE